MDTITARRHAAALAVFMYIKAVEVALFRREVGKADDRLTLHRDQRAVGAEGGVPGRQVGAAVSPGVELGGGIIGGGHRVHGIIKQGRQRRAVGRRIGAQRKIIRHGVPSAAEKR